MAIQSTGAKQLSDAILESMDALAKVSVESSKGGFFEGISVSESFKISKEDGTVIEFKPTLVEKGLLIPMFRSDNSPYYQLIDYDSIDCIIDRFLKNRLIFNIF